MHTYIGMYVPTINYLPTYFPMVIYMHYVVLKSLVTNVISISTQQHGMKMYVALCNYIV